MTGVPAGVSEAQATSVSIVALDVPALPDAFRLVRELGDLCRFYKVGSELYTAVGPDAVRQLRDDGCEVMLDLKFHDIPNTVAGAVRAGAELGARIVTVHASGGGAMIRAAVAAAGEDCDVFAVTILTSLDAAAAGTVWGRRPLNIGREVVRLASMAREGGAAGVVASGSEVAAIRKKVGSGLRVLVPGVRLPGDAAGDQSRVVTPADAARLGADYVVLGRTVTAAEDRRAAMQQVLEQLTQPPG